MKFTLTAIAALTLTLVAGCAAEGPDAAPTESGPLGVEQVAAPEVPQACLVALDHADEGFGIAADGMALFSDFAFEAAIALDAAISQDVAAMDASTATITSINAELDALTGRLNGLQPSYQAAKDECRAS